MPAVQLREFFTGAEVIANARAVKARIAAYRSPVAVQKPVVVAAPPKPEPELIEPLAILAPPDYGPVTIAKIIRMVCLHYGITRLMLSSGRRFIAIARARQVVAYFAEHYTRLTRKAIGRQLGGLDHSTVLHGVEKITALRASDPSMAADIQAIYARLFPPAKADA